MLSECRLIAMYFSAKYSIERIHVFHSFWKLAGLLALENRSRVYKKLTFLAHIFWIPIEPTNYYFIHAIYIHVHTVTMDSYTSHLLLSLARSEFTYKNMKAKLNSIYFASFLFFSCDKFSSQIFRLNKCEMLSIA